jgi:hypothetical protein
MNREYKVVVGFGDFKGVTKPIFHEMYHKIERSSAMPSLGNNPQIRLKKPQIVELDYLNDIIIKKRNK